ncbi:LppU/SCO3897 family protein [Amycolatopsis sp. NPDC004368]
MTTPPFGAPPAANPFQPPGAVPPRPGSPRPLSSTTKVLVAAGIVVALGVGVLAAFGVAAIARSAGTPVAGSCLYLSDETGGAQNYHGVSCSEQRATYRVDVVETGSSGCHGGDYVRFQLFRGTSSSRTASPRETLCLALNVSSGDCLRDVDDDAEISKVTCSDPDAEARAVVHPGEGDEDTCGTDDKVRVYTGPPERTVCLQPAGENI